MLLKHHSNGFAVGQRVMTAVDKNRFSHSQDDYFPGIGTGDEFQPGTIMEIHASSIWDKNPRFKIQLLKKDSNGKNLEVWGWDLKYSKVSGNIPFEPAYQWNSTQYNPKFPFHLYDICGVPIE